MVAMPRRVGVDGGSFVRRRNKPSSLLASISASSSRPHPRSNIQTATSHMSTTSSTDTDSEFEEEEPGEEEEGLSELLDTLENQTDGTNTACNTLPSDLLWNPQRLGGVCGGGAASSGATAETKPVVVVVRLLPPPTMVGS